MILGRARIKSQNLPPLRSAGPWPRPEQRLVAAATRRGITRKSADFVLLQRLSKELRPEGSVVLVVSDAVASVRVAAALADYAPLTQLRLLTSHSASEEFRHLRRTPVSNGVDVFNAIAAGPAPDIIIDDPRSRGFERYGLFQKTFLSLTDSGLYVARNFQDEVNAARRAGSEDTTSHWVLQFQTRDPLPKRTAWSQIAAEAFVNVTGSGGDRLVRKRGDHLMKINNLLHRAGGEANVERCVNRRSGEGAVHRISSVPARVWEVRSDFEVTDGQYAQRYLKPSYQVRELVAKVYKNAVIAPRQLVTMSGLLLPESSMQPLVRPMLNRFIKDAGPDYALDARLASPPQRLAGTFLHMDNEYPGHYGHFTSQDLTKLWAWEDALKYDRDCRVLLSTPNGREDLYPYQYRLLEAFGIDRARIQVFTGPVQVENLVNATFALQNPYFASPECKPVWSQIRERILPQAKLETPKRVFISRSGGLNRRCLNGTEVEAAFAAHGFDIVYPETLDIADQVKLFSEAEAVAGYSGSGMFTMAYSKNHPTWIIIGSKGYTATTEYLFAGLYDDPIRYVLCDPQIPQPAGGWSSEAYFSDYTFNFERDGDKLASILSRI